MGSDGPWIDPEIEGDAEHRKRRRLENGPPEDTPSRELRQILALKRLEAKAALDSRVIDPDAYLARARKRDRIDEKRRREVEWQRDSKHLPIEDMIDDPELSVPSHEEGPDHEEAFINILSSCRRLEGQLLDLRFGLGYQLQEIAKLTGIPKRRVREICQSAIEFLRWDLAVDAKEFPDSTARL